jgi:hypothetical protein
LRKLLISVVWLVVTLSLSSCGGGKSQTATHTSGIKYRAFVSNTVSAGTTSVAGLYIVNAQTDVHPLGLSPISAGNTPGMMVVTPNHVATLVYSGYNTTNPDNQFSIITNATETNSSHLTLKGYTQSFLVSPDSSTAYVAEPEATVTNSPQGAIQVIAVGGSNAGTVIGEVDIPAVEYLSIDNAGDRILAFSQLSDSIAIVIPSNVNTSQPVVTYVGGFNRPVQAFFSSDDTTAYIVNCGMECGSTSQASVQQFDMTTGTLGASVAACIPASGLIPAQCAGSIALVNGSTMYLAGTPYGTNGSPSQPCTGQTTAAQTCGLLFVVDLSSMTITGSAVITDGYHNRIAMGANGQVFIGASNCTEIIPPVPPPQGAEVRGCLSIYNTLNTAVGNNPPGGVVIPPQNGNVTGLAPIPTRDVVYVVQGYPTPGGSLFIYCDVFNSSSCPTPDALQAPPNNEPTYAPLMVGNFYDVKTVDF